MWSIQPPALSSSLRSDKIHKQCIRLADAPSYVHFCDTAMLNKDEFVLATTSSTEYKGILKYNIHQDKWIEVMQYPTDLDISCIFMTYNEDKQTIFINSRSSKIICVDLTTRTCASFECLSFNVPSAAWLVHVKGQIHVFARGAHPQHYIWNDSDNTVEKINDFPDNCQIYVNAAVYAKSKDLIILFCSSRAFQQSITSIWTYSYELHTFEEIKSVQCHDMGCCGIRLTRDDKYVIISSGSTGYTASDESNDIYVLDISGEIFTLKKCSIPAPMSASCHVAMTGSGAMDKLLVSGYINELYQTKEFVIPSDIVGLISAWYSSEMFHFIEFNTDNKTKPHYAISVADILSSLE
eukprot:369203_1